MEQEHRLAVFCFYKVEPHTGSERGLTFLQHLVCTGPSWRLSYTLSQLMFWKNWWANTSLHIHRFQMRHRIGSSEALCVWRETQLSPSARPLRGSSVLSVPSCTHHPEQSLRLPTLRDYQLPTVLTTSVRVCTHMGYKMCSFCKLIFYWYFYLIIFFFTI